MIKLDQLLWSWKILEMPTIVIKNGVMVQRWMDATKAGRDFSSLFFPGSLHHNSFILDEPRMTLQDKSADSATHFNIPVEYIHHFLDFSTL